MIQKEPYKNALSDVLGNVVGEQGVKLAVKIDPASIPVLILSIVGAIIIGGLAKDAISKALIK